MKQKPESLKEHVKAGVKKFTKHLSPDIY